MFRFTCVLAIAAAPEIKEIAAHIEEIANDTDTGTPQSKVPKLSHESVGLAAPRNVLRSARDAVILADVQANWTLGDEFAGPAYFATTDNKARANEARQLAVELSLAVKQVATVGESLLEKMTRDLEALTILATPRRGSQLTEADLHQIRSSHIGPKLQKRNRLLGLRTAALAIVADLDAIPRKSYFTCLERVRGIQARLRDEPDLELTFQGNTTLASILAKFEISGTPVPPYSLFNDVLTTAPSYQLRGFVAALVNFRDSHYRLQPQLPQFFGGFPDIVGVVSEYLTEPEYAALVLALE